MPLNKRNHIGSPKEGREYILRKNKTKIIKFKIHVKTRVTQQDDKIEPTVFVTEEKNHKSDV